MENQGYEKIRERIQEATGKKVLYTFEITEILQNLNYLRDRATISSALKEFKIDPKDYGIKIYGHAHGMKAYSYEDTWNYLRNLEMNGSIDLKNRKISSIEDLLERDFHKKNMTSTPSAKRRLGRDATSADMGYQGSGER